jgi:RimJ/RimL family protein N-acetyltransferase
VSRIITERLIIVPLTPKNLELCIGNYDEMERKLNLDISGTKPGERMKAVLNLRISKVNEAPSYYLWNTIWLIVLKEENRKIGSIMLKGYPNENGEVVIGYSIDENYRCKGYMTEALNGLVLWVFENPEACTIIADTLKSNIASQRVLEKLGMIKYNEDDECYWWKICK